VNGPQRIRLRNLTGVRQFVRMEVEGDYINLEPGDFCDVIPDLPSDPDLVLVVEEETKLAVYASDWKTVLLNGTKVDR
jgi:hypothetical protein